MYETMGKVEIFTQAYDAKMHVSSDGVLSFQLTDSAKEELTNYLLLVLPYYLEMPSEDQYDLTEIPFEQLLRLANDWQDSHPDLKLQVPIVGLPYEVPSEVKKMLETLAEYHKVSMTQFLIETIDQTHERVMNGGKI